jgi:hypothetical protein
MGLADRLRRVDERLLREPPPHSPVDASTERRYLFLAVLGLVGTMLALAFAGDRAWGVALALLSLLALGGPYIDVRTRRWLRR